MRNQGNVAERLARALLARVLDPSKKIDYAIVGLFASLPTILSVVIGNHIDRGPYTGMLNAPGWWSMSLVTPFSLFLLRETIARIAPVTSPEPPPELPGVIGLVTSASGRAAAYTALRDQILSPSNLAFTVIFMSVFSAIDVWENLEVYLGTSQGLAFADTSGWSVMFITGEVDKWANLAHLALAWTVQFILLAFTILIVVLFVRHNLFFLSRVYQRRRVAPDRADQYIVIDLADRDRCFGFRKANSAFSAQVIYLGIAGTMLLLSRFFHHQTEEKADAIYAALGFLLPFLTTEVESQVSLYSVIPDFGQWVIVLGWFVGLAIVSMPVFVKLLPSMPFTGATGEQATITGYLHEFLPDSHWPFRGEPAEAEIDALAARFAANSFWPTGNNRAYWLFNVAFFTGLILLFPVIPRDGHVGETLIVYASMFALAWGGTRVWLRLLASSLRYIDTRLVETPRVHTSLAAPSPVGGQLMESLYAGRVFISYRRSDSIAYAGRLRDTLEKHCLPDHIFQDIEEIRIGRDFADAINTALDDSNVSLVLIGTQWLDATDDRGARRLDDPDDWVRLEVTAALQRDRLLVIPVLLGGARMPDASSLPEPIRRLARLHAMEISDSRWEYDLGVLVKAIKDFGVGETSS
jgi:hypothetical protein